MKKYELLNHLNDELLDKLFGFCYARANDSFEAEELCSDIVYALIRTAHTEGEIENIYPFIWRIARNVYADFSKNRRKFADTFYTGNSDEILLNVSEDNISDNTDELLTAIYRRIAFLTKAYREVMIMFYIDGISTLEIAKNQGISEVAVRQILFSARKKIKSEVEEMAETYNKPVALDKIDYVIWGTGSPAWGDPRNVCTRMFSKHIVWLCQKKPMSASEIAEELNIPTVYIEEELEILTKGENGEYGFLRRLDNGKYAINIVLLDKNVVNEAHNLYIERAPMICKIITDYIEAHKDEYLSLPYLNKKVDMNLIIWQQISLLSWLFHGNVCRILKDKYFSETPNISRPFSVYGFVDNGKCYGAGRDGINAQNICGFSNIHIDNIYSSKIQKHFSCGHNISTDPLLQLAIRAIEGIDISSLSEQEKEHAAKAIESGYLYRDDDTLYTKILVHATKDSDKIFEISNGLQNGYFESEAEIIAEKLAKLIKTHIPEYLHREWNFVNNIANLPSIDYLIDYLIEKGIITAPEDCIGAEGCWMSVSK